MGGGTGAVLEREDSSAAQGRRERLINAVNAIRRIEEWYVVMRLMCLVSEGRTEN